MAGNILEVVSYFAAFVAGFLVTRFRYKQKSKNKKIASKPMPSPLMNLDFSNAMAILTMVTMECIEERKFALRVMEKTALPPVDEEISFMVEKTLLSLGDPFLNHLQLYVSRKYIISHISTNMRQYCQEYIEEVRFGKK